MFVSPIKTNRVDWGAAAILLKSQGSNGTKQQPLWSEANTEVSVHTGDLSTQPGVIQSASAPPTIHVLADI